MITFFCNSNFNLFFPRIGMLYQEKSGNPAELQFFINRFLSTGISGDSWQQAPRHDDVTAARLGPGHFEGPLPGAAGRHVEEEDPARYRGYGEVSHQEPILRFFKFTLQRERCSRPHRFSKQKKFFSKTR
jgi:hypothetical protein